MSSVGRLLLASLFLFVPSRPLTVEDSKSLHLIDGEGIILDFEGKYVDTAAVWTYILIFSLLMSFFMFFGCAALCYIRWFYKRKTNELIAALEAAHSKQLVENAAPSPFAVDPNNAFVARDGGAASMEIAQKERERITIAPATLAALLHNAMPEHSQAVAQNAPDPSILLEDSTKAPQPTNEAVGEQLDSLPQAASQL